MNRSDYEILSKQEVKALLRFKSNSGFQNLINSGKFPKGFRIGIRRVGWYKKDVYAWLDKQAAKSYEEIRGDEINVATTTP